MATFLTRSLGSRFADRLLEITGSFHEDINAVALAGITIGCTTTSFCPDATVTRDNGRLYRAFGAPALSDYNQDWTSNSRCPLCLFDGALADANPDTCTCTCCACKLQGRWSRP